MILSDNVGVIQHAVENVPNRTFGYCTDDVSRAFMVAVAYARLVPSDRTSHRLASTYLAFMQHAQLEDGRFHNFMDYDRRWTDEIGTHDSNGRALWALGYGVANAPGEAWRRVCGELLDRAIPVLGELEYLRSRAYALLGFTYAYASTQNAAYATALRTLADEILAAYEETAAPGWVWFEDVMTYDNARLSESLVRAGRVLGEPRYSDAGLKSLAFYAEVTTENGCHVPIGNEGWYRRGGKRARYVQQPLEAFAMVDAQLAAFDLTDEPAHFAAAELAVEWYYGKNSRGVVMANGGACYDGLSERDVNRNQGAESTLAFLAAAYAMAQPRTRVLRAVR